MRDLVKEVHNPSDLLHLSDDILLQSVIDQGSLVVQKPNVYAEEEHDDYVTLLGRLPLDKVRAQETELTHLEPPLPVVVISVIT